MPTLDLDFQNGFTAITGETGAGKSILVDALGLLLGGRSDTEWVRAGATRAELTAEFSLTDNPAASQWLQEADLSVDDSCLLRRTINASGRSRAFINGTPVTVTQMQGLGHLLVEIHGQNEHLRLTKSSQQLQMLDKSSSYMDELNAVSVAYSAWLEILQKLKVLDADSSMSSAELEFLSFQLAEMDQQELSAEAISALQQEHDRLAAGDTLLEALTAGIERMEPDPTGPGKGVNSGLNATLAQLREFSSLDSDINDACQMLQEAVVNCDEATAALRAARDRVELDPQKFAGVVARLDNLNNLARKHRVRMEELQAVRNKLAMRIEAASTSGQRRSQLETELSQQLEDYHSAARTLHKKRSSQARKLAKQVSLLMAKLGMGGGVFELPLTLDQDALPRIIGDDHLQINISANPGTAPGPLQKIASGGELSRISLAIKVAAAGRNENISQIFDEVDAGIGGDTANAVGRLLKQLSTGGQVLCVTHLAQVAVCASQQLQVQKVRVQKAANQTATIVDTQLLDSDGRVDEIARMLSGRLSDQSRAHAVELLSSAKSAG